MRQENVTAGGIERGHVSHGSAATQTRDAYAGLIRIGFNLVQIGKVGGAEPGRHLPGRVQFVDMVGVLGHRSGLDQWIKNTSVAAQAACAPANITAVAMALFANRFMLSPVFLSNFFSALVSEPAQRAGKRDRNKIF